MGCGLNCSSRSIARQTLDAEEFGNHLLVFVGPLPNRRAASLQHPTIAPEISRFCIGSSHRVTIAHSALRAEQTSRWRCPACARRRIRARRGADIFQLLVQIISDAAGRNFGEQFGRTFDITIGADRRRGRGDCRAALHPLSGIRIIYFFAGATPAGRVFSS